MKAVLQIKVPSDKYKLEIGKGEASGFDIKAFLPFPEYECGTLVIPKGQRVIVPTGVYLNVLNRPITLDFDIQVRGRSGLAFKHGIFAHLGTIDVDYTGEIKVILFNLGDSDYVVRDKDRIGQLVFGVCVNTKQMQPCLKYVDDFHHISSDRGEDGFGSSGK